MGHLMPEDRRSPFKLLTAPYGIGTKLLYEDKLVPRVLSVSVENTASNDGRAMRSRIVIEFLGETEVVRAPEVDA